MIYLVVLLLLIYLSFHFDICEKERNKLFWYYISLLTLILIAGLRWRIGVDTPNYMYKFYYEYPPLDKFSFDDYGIGKDPFYVLINSIVKYFDGRFFVVQLIQSSIVNILVFRYFKKHSRYVFTCILFYFACYCFTEFNMQIMRGSISIVICLYANDYFLEKKWLKGISLLFLALLFHAQTIVMFILPIFYFIRFNKLGVFFIFFSFVAGAFLNLLLADYLVILELANETASEKAALYAGSDYMGNQTHNLKFIAVLYLPWVYYSLFAIWLVKKRDKTNHIFFIEPLAMVGIMLVMIQLNFQIAYRFVDYYRIYFIMLFAELFLTLVKYNSVLCYKVRCFRAIVIFIPLFFMIGFDYYRRQVEYFPYSSVINRKIDKSRELDYHSREIKRPDAHFNEY